MPTKPIPDAPIDPNKPISQRKFAALLGVLPQVVNQWVNEGWLPKEGTFRDWARALGSRIKERQLATKVKPEPVADEGDSTKLDLNQEKAALARTQRLIQEVKLATARGEYAPVGLLADVLAQASGAVVAQFDQMEGRLAKACPDLPEAAKLTVLNTLAAARNVWIAETAELIKQQIESNVDDEGEE